MKITRTLFFVCCLSFVGITGNAQNRITYLGNQLPEKEGWNKLSFDNTQRDDVGTPVTATTQDNVLKLEAAKDPFTGDHFDNNFKYKQLGWYKTNLGFDASVGYTVEIKAKVTGSNGSFTINGFDNSGTGFRLIFYPNKIIESTGSLLQNVLNTDSNSDDFHTYRIAVFLDNTVHVYRNGVSLGSFPLSTWAGDNIVVDGGFESNTGLEYWTRRNDNGSGGGTLSVSNDPNHTNTGTSGLFVDGGTHAYDRIPLKQGTTYDISLYAKTVGFDFNVDPSDPNFNDLRDAAWTKWRDLNVYYDGGKMLDVNTKLFSDGNWHSHSSSRNTGNSNKVIEIEFWAGGDRTNQTAIDNLLLTERVAPPAYAIPAGAINLFPNGDFEDPDFDYFPSGDPRNEVNLVYQSEADDAPDWHPFWGARVRMQYSRQNGNNEAGPYFARSGKYSLRYFNCFGNDAQYGDNTHLPNPDDHRGYNSNLNTSPVDLEAGKTYTFSFWYHFATYGGDHLILVVKNGNTELFRETVNNSVFPNWKNASIQFTTDADNHALTIHTERDGGTPGVLYLDDLYLYEGARVPYDNTYLFFGKPTGVEGVDVEIKSIMYDNSKAYPVQRATGFTVSGDDITENGATSQMSSTKVFANPGADYEEFSHGDIVWSLAGQDDAGVASISADGLLSPSTNGTVTVMATATFMDGSSITGTKSVTISNQTSTSVKEISGIDNFKAMSVYSVTGIKLLETNDASSNAFKRLSSGIYIVKIENKDGSIITQKIIQK